jgi:hypothetical protein
MRIGNIQGITNFHSIKGTRAQLICVTLSQFLKLNPKYGEYLLSVTPDLTEIEIECLSGEFTKEIIDMINLMVSLLMVAYDIQNPAEASRVPQGHTLELPGNGN